MKTVSLFLFAVLLLTGCGAPMEESSSSEAEGTVYESVHHDFRLVTVVDGFSNPWSVAFLPNGDMLVTEKGRSGDNGMPGQLRIVRDGTLLPDPVPGVPEVRLGGQGGLLDVVLHPDFEENQYIYLSYAKSNDDDSEGTTAVSRGRLVNDELVDVEEIFEAQAWVSGRGHHGSRLDFDGDGHLFVTVGDRQVSPSGTEEEQRSHPSQNLMDHHGTVNRLNDDGSIPEDNPFVGREDALPSIWSYGHRNPQGLYVNPETNEVWETEHGPQGGDELNYVQPGVNYGWPVIGFGVNYGAGAPLHHIIDDEEFQRPVMHWTPSIAPAGLVMYTGDHFPEWQGSLFAGGMSGQYRELTRITVDGNQFVSKETFLPGELRIRHVNQGPDGYLYLVIDDQGGNPSPILRLEPVN